MSIPAEVVDFLISLAVGGAAIAALAALWVAALALRQKTQGDQRWEIVSYFVNMAEQMLIEQEGAAKLDWVTTQVKARYPKLDTTLIRAMIETAVRQMKTQTAGGSQ